MEQDIADKFATAETRMAALDARIAAAETRLTVVESEGVKDRTALTALTAKVDALTRDQKLQLEILTRLDGVASNPHFKVILAIVASILGSWAAAKGLK